MKNKMIELVAWIIGILVVFQNLVIIDVLTQANASIGVFLGCCALTLGAILAVFFIKEELKKEND